MSGPDFSFDGLIRYFEMAYKVMGYKEPEKSSYEYHAVQTLRKLREERDRACQRLQDIKDGFEGCCPACETVAVKNDLLRKERDQARREVCEARTDIGFSRPIVSHLIEFAASRGWDCYEETSDV